MKTFFKKVIYWVLILLVGVSAIWGANTVDSDTELGWLILGYFAESVCITVPLGIFWSNTLRKVLNLEQENE
jgi:hypothetical protein